MKTSKSYLERHDWTLRLQDAPQPGVNATSSSRSIDFLKTLWQGLVKTLSGSNELRVWQASDPDGYIHWRAHDPLTGESAICDSEDEMRVWIEQRYHNHPDLSEQWYQKQYYQLLPLR